MLEVKIEVFQIFFCEKDSESRRFQFDQGTYPRLSQSTRQQRQQQQNPQYNINNNSGFAQIPLNLPQIPLY